MDFTKVVPILIEAASFIAAFAGIFAAVTMARFIRRFVTGILAIGFKTIGIGIFVLALAIVIDAVNLYFQAAENVEISFLLIVRQIFFVIGTYIIVIGSKNMGDKLEQLSGRKSA
jgi:hypothetical protein